MPTDPKTYDPKTASPQVRVLVDWLIKAWNPGQPDTSLPEAIADTEKRLVMLNCDPDYITSALEYAHVEGDKDWPPNRGTFK